MNSASRPMVCIIGAGPYGLAIAAHLQFVGIDFLIFGSPMRRWLSQMPKSMLLKSEGCASSLPDPAGRHSLAQYCREEGLPYSEYGAPVSREVLARYAVSFQQKLVPHVEDVLVIAVSKLRDGFELSLSSGEKLHSANVIVATGMDYMAHSPEELGRLPAELWSHSADHYDLSKFRGKDVAVIGGGQSGLETAAILREERVSVSLLVRAPTLAWNRIPSTARRSGYERVRRPRTRLGDGLQLWVYDNVPWWLKDRVVGQMPVFLGHQIRAVEARGGRIALQITDQNDRPKELLADHVIASTGYRFDLQNLPFFGQSLTSQIRKEKQLPQLSSNFESAVHGLYFTGIASANSFGSAMRFLAGTGYTARRIASHVATNHRPPAATFAALQKCLEK